MNVTLLHKFLSGECNTHEQQRVENWLNADVRNQAYMHALKQIWEVRPGKKIEVDAQTAWESVRRRSLEAPEPIPGDTPAVDLDQPGSGYLASSARRHRGYDRGRALAYSFAAAAVILITFMVTRYVSLDKTSPQPQQMVQEVVTERGQRTTFRLFDGTRVHLNVDSRLTIPTGFGKAARQVYLEGEAYFEVASNSGKPFLVHAGAGVTQVLGTKFNVRAYPEESQVQVVVAEGKVRLGSEEHGNGPNIQLTRNRRGILSQSGEMVASTVLNLDEYLGWKAGKLIFHDASLSEVKRRLERWYDIEITLQNEFSPLTRRLTASFESESLREVLNVMALALEVEYKRDGRKVIIFRNE